MRNKKCFIGVRTAFAVFVLTIFVVTMFVALTPVAIAASQEQVLYSFYDSGGAVLPVAGVIPDASGNLYGTTFYGGANGVGMVFELTPTASGWKEKVLHSFNTDGVDGFWVTGGLVFDAAGNLYGTTEFGGTGACSVLGGCGTVFELSPTASGEWTETILHDFQGPDGWEVHAGLAIDTAGNLYGTTANGGAYNQGTVFEVSPSADGSWTQKVLHHFTGGPDGGVPYGNVTLDAAGNVYGMTSAGGGTTSACKYGCGTVFELSYTELSPTADAHWTGKLLHNFSTSTGDGRYPSAGLTFDAAGNLYGTTGAGGGNGHFNAGIVFELTIGASGKWTEKVLHNFNQTSADGVNPSGNVIFDKSGNLYSVTLNGGSSGHGTVFELTPTASGSWTETILHNFSNQGIDAANPVAGVIFDKSDNMYGTTDSGGSYGEGAVFEIAH
jgi:uncharacterized repeat protein (TIGR03803 family)